jgi:transposase
MYKWDRVCEASLKDLAYPSGNRAHMLKLNAKGITVPEIARIFDCHEHTVRATIKRWEKLGIAGLRDAPGQGAKPKQKSNKEEILLKSSTKLNEEMRSPSAQRCVATSSLLIKFEDKDRTIID